MADILEDLERHILAYDKTRNGDTFMADTLRRAKAEIERLRADLEWRDIATAKKDGRTIWGVFRGDLVEFTGRDDLDRWAGLQVPLRHLGLLDSGLDIGWNIAAPVGQGGFADSWIAGWMPLPSAPPARLAEGAQDA